MFHKPTESKVELCHRLVTKVLKIDDDSAIEILEERLCQEAAERGSDEVEVTVKDLEGFADDFDLKEFEAETIESKMQKALWYIIQTCAVCPLNSPTSSIYINKNQSTKFIRRKLILIIFINIFHIITDE